METLELFGNWLQSLELYSYSIQHFLIHVGIPVCSMLLIERFLLLYYFNTPQRRKIIQRQFYLQPNFISYFRCFMGVISVIIFYFVSHEAGMIFWGFWAISDITDGTIARHYNLTTKEGASIDPLSDKFLYLPPLFFFTWAGYCHINIVIIFTFTEIIGQTSRLFSNKKSANLFGKAKTLLTNSILIILSFEYLYFPQSYWEQIDWALLVIILLSFFSFASRLIPNYWYANLLSFINFLMGIIGVILIIQGYDVAHAFLLVFLGQFFDLFDGRAADRWGSTPYGELFDNIADGTNFGITISFILFTTLQVGAIFICLLYAICIILRLSRFLIGKRKHNIKTGTKYFQGLPAPAAALLVGSASILIFRFRNFFPNFAHSIFTDAAQIILIVTACILMLSKIPYVHFGRVTLPTWSTHWKLIILTIIILVLLIGANTGYLTFFILIFSASLLYLFFGIGKKERIK